MFFILLVEYHISTNSTIILLFSRTPKNEVSISTALPFVDQADFCPSERSTDKRQHRTLPSVCWFEQSRTHPERCSGYWV